MDVMDAIITTILTEGGKSLLKDLIQKGMEKLARRKKARLSAEEKKKIEGQVEKMVRAATDDEVFQYSPPPVAVRRAARAWAVKSKKAPGKGAPAHRKVAKKVTVRKKATVRQFVRKAATVKRSVVKKAATKKR